MALEKVDGNPFADSLDPLIESAAEKYGIPENRLRAVVQAESDFNPQAVSSAGAQGLMQLMPATAKDLGVTDPVDPAQSIDGGARYLSQLYNKYGDWDTAHAAYNFGPGNIDKGKPLPAETQGYLQKINAQVGDDGLERVEGNPFAKADNAAPHEDSNLEPVQGDPFAKAPEGTKPIETTLAELAAMPLPERIARITAGLPVGAAETAVQMAAQVPQMAYQAAGFLKALSEGKISRSDFDQATKEITPKWVSDLANAEVLQPETYAGALLSHAAGEAFSKGGQVLAAPGAGLKASIEAAVAGEGTEGARQRFEQNYAQLSPVTEQALNLAFVKEGAQHAAAATLDAARALRDTTQPPAEVLNAGSVDDAIKAAQNTVDTASAQNEAPAPVEQPLATALSANADKRSALLAGQPIEDLNARTLESEPAPESGGVEPAFDQGVRPAEDEVQAQEPIAQVPPRPEAAQGEVNDQAAVPLEDAAAQRPAAAEGMDQGGDDLQHSEASAGGERDPIDAEAGDHRVADEVATEAVAPQATNVAPEATFTDYTAPKSDDSRGIVKGEIRTFKTEKTAAAFVKQQGIRGFSPRETEDGWVLSKPTVQRVPQKMTVNADDHALDVIAKSGGIRPDAVDGADPKDIQSANRANFLKPFRSNGMSLDGAAEVLASNGFDVLDEAGRPDATKANEILHRAIVGEKVRSPEGQEIARSKAEAAQVAAMQRAGIPDGIEKRSDLDLRKQVSQMSPEEMRQALLTSERTGLGNQRAYDEAPRKPVQASIDADSLKWINDNIGHEAGNQLLAEIGHAMKSEGLDAYHLSGDEFAAQFDHSDAAQEALGRVRNRLANVEITAVGPEGQRITKKGVDFSYGLGKDLSTADEELRQDKRWREDAGVRAGRGEEPPGVVRELAVQARIARGESAPGPERTAEPAVTETPADAGVSASGVAKREPASVSTPRVEDVPPALLKRITVPVDRYHEGEGVKTEQVAAHEALAEHDAEISAYEKLLECVKGAA